jgi:hypothetical protein
MPSKRIGGYLCYFVSYDCTEPPHIHLAKGKERYAPSAKFWLAPIELAHNRGLSSRDIQDARRILQEYQTLFLEMWDEHCND